MKLIDKFYALLDRVSILRQVQAGFISVLIIFLIIGAIIYQSSNGIIAKIDTLKQNTIPAVKINQRLSRNMLRGANDIYRWQAGLNNLTKAGDLTKNDINRLKPYLNSEEAKLTLEEINDLNYKIKGLTKQLLKIKDNSSVNKRIIISQIDNAIVELNKENLSLSRYNWDQLDQSINQIIDSTSQIRSKSLITILIIAIISFVIGVAVTLRVNRISTSIKDRTYQAAKKEKEVNQLVNQMKKISEEVKIRIDNTLNILNSSNKSNYEIFEAINQVSVSIKEVSEGTDHLSVQAEDISEAGKSTYELIKETDQTISFGNQIIDETADSMLKLQASLNQVTKISDKIMEITDQTNLLSLNASIEAARAGEKGRGFAIVAEEIKNLADESMGAAQDVKKIIEEVTAVSEKAVKNMIEKQEKKSIVNIFAKIDNLSEQVVGRMQEVIELSENQASFTEEMTALTQQISASSQEISDRTDNSTAKNQELEEIMAELIEENQQLVNKIEVQNQVSKEQLKLIDNIVLANKNLK
ncbi:methyl-accepting chemotaxis protein [Orenia marismortui]|uniref:Methyl-accepting chemotaxis protein n=1 Tax=Orenia marismortui TaxID=46469 RepID=A0A4R8GT44_9FIRM|nr:methyl-accepting chemotaxis protein [Orenia marismortui]TDX49220.1 methyl-accepting chemotaxis protein [Orenia marismortui]